MLDAMDVMLYSFALITIRAEFHLSSAAAGALGAAPLVTSALGGMLFGWLSDRYGRARALMWSILAFSAFTAFTATSRSVGELVFWRAIVGIGLGGEWAAGSVLVPALATLWIRRNIAGTPQWTRPTDSRAGALAARFRPPLLRHVLLFTAMC